MVDTNTILFMTTAFLAVALLMLALGMLLRDVLARRDVEEDETAPVLPPRPPQGTAIDRAFFQLLAESGSRLEPAGAMALVIGAGIVGGAIPLVLFENFIGAAAGLVVGCCLPILAWAGIRWRRLSHMRTHLPETLQIVADAVRAGHTLEEASAFVRQDMSGPLAEEFAYAEKQLSLGHSPVAVLDNMVRRIPLPEFRIFATAVLVHRKSGGNLPLLTERLAATARDRQEVHGHLMAVTAGSRLSAIGMVVGAAVAMSFLTWLEPSYIRAFTSNRLGPTLLMIAGGLQLIGMVWVWRILRVSY